MADEPITEGEQSGMGILNPDVHDQRHRGEAEPTDPSSSTATTSSPPSWWQQCAGAHDQQQAQKQGQLNLVGPHGHPTGGDWAATAGPTKEEVSSVNETCAQCEICPCTCDSPCDHNCECFVSENQDLEMVRTTTTPPAQW